MHAPITCIWKFESHPRAKPVIHTEPRQSDVTNPARAHITKHPEEKVFLQLRLVESSSEYLLMWSTAVSQPTGELIAARQCSASILTVKVSLPHHDLFLCPHKRMHCAVVAVMVLTDGERCPNGRVCVRGVGCRKPYIFLVTVTLDYRFNFFWTERLTFFFSETQLQLLRILSK